MTTSTRYIVRAGIAAYLGGTFQENIRAYTGGNLSAQGLGAVRAAYPKKVNMQDAFLGVAPGSMSGAIMTVAMDDDAEVKKTMAGTVQQTYPATITSGGWKRITYQVLLDCYFWSQHLYGEDAEQDCDNLIEAIKQQLRYDRTLGGICIDAGMTTRGIRTHKGHPAQDKNERTGIWFTIEFECRVDIVA